MSCGDGSGVKIKTLPSLNQCLRSQPFFFFCLGWISLKNEVRNCYSCLIFFFFNLQAAKKAGLSDSDVEAALQLYTSQPIKDKLKNTTEHALSYGVGSILFFLVDKTKFY